jgi:hypothetical protein
VRVKVECPNPALYQIKTCFEKELCRYPFEADAESESVRCPACNQSVNVKKLVEKRQYKLIR